ncbi:MAG: hypothetical protein IJ632_01435 [Muribaculaceae bacterium]|nr:hypothetical protein [Muribaculaceae bacterium]
MDVQKAGNNSVQLQVQNLNLGIDEKRAREICREQFEVAKRDYTEEAVQIANGRISEFEDRLIPRLQCLENGLSSLASPEFQLLLGRAQRVAAATDQQKDYDVLTELLAARIEHGHRRETRAGIKRAVEIVDEVSDEALQGLTLLHALHTFRPVAKFIGIGLDALNNLYQDIIYSDLPQGERWIDHLDVLGAVRIVPFSKFSPLDQLLGREMNGYVCTGMESGSQDHQATLQALAALNISQNGLIVQHELNPGYYRFNVVHQSDPISFMIQVMPGVFVHQDLTAEQDKLIRPFMARYPKDTVMLQQVQARFREQMQQRPHIKQAMDWHDRLPVSLQITAVGRALAHANAQRLHTGLPALKD